VKEYYDRVLVVFIHDLKVHGTIEKMGAFASVVKYNKDDIEYEHLVENDEFAIIDEIVFEHIVEEEN
jgi:hypothetical protein